MTEPIKFTKLSGSGNDFICIANLDGRYDALLADPPRVAEFARSLCRRGHGVGADGLIFACRPEVEGVADVAARFMEPDGSESELCGNGTACFVKFLLDGDYLGKKTAATETSDKRLVTSDKSRSLPVNSTVLKRSEGSAEPDGLSLVAGHLSLVASSSVANSQRQDSQRRELRILTPAGVVLGREVDNGYIRVCIPIPTGMQHNMELPVDHLPVPVMCDFAVTGVPHAVVFVEDVDRVDMPHLGPAMRYHPRFGPRGANVNFVQVLGPGRLAIRTWEFGVEGETLACGTGSATAAVMASLRHDWPPEFTNGDASIDLRVHGGDILRVWLTRQSDTITDLCLDSVVRPVFHGVLAAEMATAATSDK